MIDAILFRCRVGLHQHRHHKLKSSSALKSQVMYDLCGLNSFKQDSVLLICYYIFILYIYMTILRMLCECNFSSFPLSRFSPISINESLSSYYSHIKLFSVVLIYSLFKRSLRLYLMLGVPSGYLSRLNFSSLRSKKCNISKSYIPLCIYKLRVIMNGCVFWALTLNAILIVLVNPSLLNPGPTNYLKVVSFNTRGLLPFSQLDSKNPTLDNTKLFELQYYLSDQKPDILVLNETWLKKSVSDNEVIPMEDYKVFRLDRSPKTHPPDPDNPSKFRRFGGGILIAVRRDLDIVSTKLEFTCAAEIIGITLKFGDGRKIILCSFYRVGTLGTRNHAEFLNFAHKARKRRGVTGIVFTGDFNMPNIDWDSYSSNDNVDQLFLDSFSNLGFEQLVNSPTHVKGNILDLVLTDKPQLIGDIKVSSSNLPCKSDHYSITFTIKSKVKRVKTVKRDAYNFKRANWSSLNSELNAVDWDQILSGDVETAWLSFKDKLSSCADRHIPKIRIGGKTQPPWFDAEIHQACRKKERLHSAYKGETDPTQRAKKYFEFSNSRSDFKHRVTEKLSTSFDDVDDSNLITKKFWSYVKATSSNTRIPELVHLDNIYKNTPVDQSRLFNTFFYQQFSEPSHYDINIEYSPTNDDFGIEYSPTRICGILSKLNANKAIGPDKIHGRILKNCAAPISFTLSIFFNKSYNSGHIPSEWKAALIVPVHKKGSKSDIKNYRPISLTSLVVKVMERIVRDELMLKCSRFLDPRQHGFLPGKSCSTQLVEYCDSLSLSLNSKQEH